MMQDKYLLYYILRNTARIATSEFSQFNDFFFFEIRSLGKREESTN